MGTSGASRLPTFNHRKPGVGSTPSPLTPCYSGSDQAGLSQDLCGSQEPGLWGPLGCDLGSTHAGSTQYLVTVNFVC